MNRILKELRMLRLWWKQTVMCLHEFERVSDNVRRCRKCDLTYHFKVIGRYEKASDSDTINKPRKEKKTL